MQNQLKVQGIEGSRAKQPHSLFDRKSLGLSSGKALESFDQLTRIKELSQSSQTVEINSMHQKTVYNSIMNPKQKLRTDSLEKVRVKKPNIKLSPHKAEKLKDHFLNQSYNWDIRDS